MLFFLIFFISPFLSLFHSIYLYFLLYITFLCLSDFNLFKLYQKYYFSVKL